LNRQNARQILLVSQEKNSPREMMTGYLRKDVGARGFEQEVC
jgi:hypothetical protein